MIQRRHGTSLALCYLYELDTATYQMRGNVVESYQRPNDNH